MYDILYESLRVALLVGILVCFMRADKDVNYGRRGFLLIKIGFLLVLFGSFMDITDNFESLNWTMVIGDTPIQAFLEKVVGYFGGFVMIAMGFWLWLPSFRAIENVREDIEKARKGLERQLFEKSNQLEREVNLRRAVETELFIAEERRMMLYEKAPVPIVHGIIGGSLVEWNNAFVDILGYDSQEELDVAVRENGGSLCVLACREEAEKMLELLRTRSSVKDYEVRLKRKDGTILWARLDFTTVQDKDGVNYYFYCFAADITERKKAAELLARSERNLKKMLDKMPIGLTLLDEETREVVDVNTSLLSMTGYERDNLVGQTCCGFLCQSGKPVCPSLDEGCESAGAERVIRKKNGEDLVVLKTVSRLDLDGHSFLLEAFVDISEQKRLEHLKEDVDRIVAHDLKAPIIGVISACKVLLLDENVRGDIREVLETIETQGNKVLRMVGMSLTMYRMEAGTYEYFPEQVEFMSVIRSVLIELGDMARSLGITVEVRRTDGEDSVEQGVEVMGQGLLYESMLANLVKNAIEASPLGKAVILEVGKCDPGVMRLSITNSGVVPPDVRETFFDKYATFGKSGGTGLGTYSASLIVRTVGGEISMKTSDEENRTTISVTLPCA